jgi:hypothetical protein
MSDTINTPEMEQEARAMGWVPSEEFRGDQARWVDASTFVERGHTVLPIVKKKNAELQSQLEQMANENKRLAQLFAETQQSVKDLQEFHNTNTKKQVEQARKQLLEELKQAKRDGDVDLEVELTDQLNQANAALTKPAVVPPIVPPIVPPAPQVDPDTVSWADANRWYGTDARKTSLANSIANGLRADPENDHLVGKAFYDLVDKELSFRLNGGVGSSKVGSGNHSGDGGNTKGRTPTYNDLDPDAKRICDAEGKKFVGEGKLYKTQAEWRQYYANAVLGV